MKLLLAFWAAAAVLHSPSPALGEGCRELPAGVYGAVRPCGQQSSTSTVKISTLPQNENQAQGPQGIGYIPYDEFNRIDDPLFKESTRMQLSGESGGKENKKGRSPPAQEQEFFPPLKAPGMNSDADSPWKTPDTGSGTQKGKDDWRDAVNRPVTVPGFNESGRGGLYRIKTPASMERLPKKTSAAELLSEESRRMWE